MSENKRKSSQSCLFPQPSNLKWRWVLTVDLRIYLKSILLEFRFFRLASFFWISPEKCKIRFWQFRAAPWPRDIVGFPAPLLIFKLSLQVGTRSTKHACARFWKFSFFSSRKTRARQHEKKGEKSLPLLLPSLLFSWLSPLLISPPSLLSGQAWKKLQSFEYLHGKRDSSRRRMTRARPSPSRLYLLPAMRLLSHLLPREAQGLLLAKIHAKKKITTKSERELKIYTSKRQYVLMNESFMSYLFVVQRTLEMWHKETIGARAEDL